MEKHYALITLRRQSQQIYLQTSRNMSYIRKYSFLFRGKMPYYKQANQSEMRDIEGFNPVMEDGITLCMHAYDYFAPNNKCNMHPIG